MANPSETLALVTGGSGFLAGHCIVALLAEGYKVRATLRSLAKSSTVRASLKNAGIEESSLARLTFVVADLSKDDGWEKAVEGCNYVLHVASPFPAAPPKHEGDLIIPARDGALRVLRAAKAASVKHVVLTSSFAAIGYGHPPQSQPFDEKSWTNMSSPVVTPYEKSKTIAEKAAWDYVNSEDGKGLELSVVNPVGMFGPVLSEDFSTSIILIQRQMNGGLPGCPDLTIGVVDVRDAASLHLLAMINPAANGERLLAVAPPSMTVQEIAMTLKQRLPLEARNIRTRILPDLLLRFVALWDSEVAYIVPSLGLRLECTNEKARRLLGWEPRSREDAIIATAKSLLKLGLLNQ